MESLERGLQKATVTSLVVDAKGDPYFIPPYVVADFPPYVTMAAQPAPGALRRHCVQW